jgi:hypothetical protein
VKVQPLFLITTVTFIAQLGSLLGSRRVPQRPDQPSQVRRRASFPLDTHLAAWPFQLNHNPARPGPKASPEMAPVPKNVAGTPPVARWARRFYRNRKWYAVLLWFHSRNAVICCGFIHGMLLFAMVFGLEKGNSA